MNAVIESGRVFAVIADEVRALASKIHESKVLVEKTKQSSDEIESALSAIVESVSLIKGMVYSVVSAP